VAAQKLFTLMGIPFTVDRRSWQFVPPKFIIGVVVPFIALPDLSLLDRMMTGFLFGGLLILVLALHILGHILSSK
jgi:hypothetical protein